MKQAIQRLRRRTRAARFQVFKSFAEKLRSDIGIDTLKIIDLGGSAMFWEYWWPVQEEDGFEITLINNHDVDQTQKMRQPTMPFIRNVNRDATTVTEQEFARYDLVFSNSFLEHLDGWQTQKALAERVVASGRPYFHQVPNKLSPVDPHHPFAPYFALLPYELRVRILTVSAFAPGSHRVSLADARRWQDRYCPLGLSDMRRLFPDGEFHVERPMGVPMSILAYRGPKVAVQAVPVRQVRAAA